MIAQATTGCIAVSGVNLWQDERCCAPDDDVLTTFVIECIANMHHQLKYDFYKKVITSECRII